MAGKINLLKASGEEWKFFARTYADFTLPMRWFFPLRVFFCVLGMIFHAQLKWCWMLRFTSDLSYWDFSFESCLFCKGDYVFCEKWFFLWGIWFFWGQILRDFPDKCPQIQTFRFLELIFPKIPQLPRKFKVSHQEIVKFNFSQLSLGAQKCLI